MKKNNKFKIPVQDTNIEVFQATVINITNKQVQVLSQGEIISCLIPGSLISNKNDLGIGDWVEVGIVGSNQYKLLKILPRKTAIYRGNRRSLGDKVLIAANVQFLLVIVTADYLLNQAGYIEAAIIAAKRAEVEVGVFISKWDRVGENTQDLLRTKIALYQVTANFVIAGSAHEPQEELMETVKGKTVLVVGDRSCGKTTLINQSLREQLKEEVSREAIPSTHTSILKVGSEETYWIDTPGFRNFALQEVTVEERNAVFPEIAQLTEGCYFRNCTHEHEDGCQVLDALREKKLNRERYDAYQEMIDKKVFPYTDVKKIDYRNSACTESFTCKVCGTLVVPEGAGSRHRNHCPKCLSSVHVDNEPGDRRSLCKGIMEPVSVWVRKGGEWAIIHRCRICGTLSSNRIAADDNPALLMSIAVKPLAMTPFPLDKIEEIFKQ